MFKSLVWYSVFTLAAATEIIKLEPPNVNGFLIDSLFAHSSPPRDQDPQLTRHIQEMPKYPMPTWPISNSTPSTLLLRTATSILVAEGASGAEARLALLSCATGPWWWLLRCKWPLGSCIGFENVQTDKRPSGNLTGIGVYMAVDTRRKEVVLSLRGSNNIRNYITDVVFAWSDCDLTGGCKLHAGFLQAWDEIKDRITAAIKKARRRRPNYRLVVTGHSLGGAVATVAAAHLRAAGLAVDLYTYGSPRVGNDAFAIWFGRQRGGEWRVTHEDDPVPRLPPLFLGYRHTSPEYWLFGGESATTSYTVSHISVCRGIANVDCNAARWNTDPVAHLYYLGATSACAESPLQVRAAAYGQDALPQDVKDRLTAWSLRDQQQFVKEVET
jgi:hypothetical protein